MLSDIEIAQNAKIKNIADIAKEIGFSSDDLEFYGKYKAKISEQAIKSREKNKNGKLILVTAINPTPAGEGKTTISVGLSGALKEIGENVAVALREPSLGPVFGVKGGAAGGGYSQVLPMEDINLHFTGDMHAITAANNLICAIIDNHIQQGNVLAIDPRTITMKRVLDINDRELRNIVVGLGGKINGTPREDGFSITVASEIMAILCLSKDLEDLKNRIANILVGYSYDGDAIFCKDLNIQGSAAVLLKDAIMPNIVQTLDGVPCFMHGGPFANIAHGCNSIRATSLALKSADYCVTEAGFGSDLGAEKFLDIKCRVAGLTPNCIVIVATIRALKYNGGVTKELLKLEDVNAVLKGSENLVAHIENMKKYGVPVVVALNSFNTDTKAEQQVVFDVCERLNTKVSKAEVFAKGGKGGIELAKLVVDAANSENHYSPIYDLELNIEEKIKAIATKIYGASGVEFSPNARKTLDSIAKLGFNRFPVCIAKTQYSLSDNPTLLARPKNFNLNIKEIKISSGAGFIVALAGDIMTMPGLPKHPAALNIDIDKSGKILGLF
ncbi:MAG: formate--tetrahydrofolate ligase [Clostridia bacterium]